MGIPSNSVSSSNDLWSYAPFQISMMLSSDGQSVQVSEELSLDGRPALAKRKHGYSNVTVYHSQHVLIYPSRGAHSCSETL